MRIPVCLRRHYRLTKKWKSSAPMNFSNRKQKSQIQTDLWWRNVSWIILRIWIRVTKCRKVRKWRFSIILWLSEIHSYGLQWTRYRFEKATKKDLGRWRGLKRYEEMKFQIERITTQTTVYFYFSLIEVFRIT
jgi:hypothetical protein